MIVNRRREEDSLGEGRRFRDRNFTAWELARHTWNRYAVENEETRDDPDI